MNDNLASNSPADYVGALKRLFQRTSNPKLGLSRVRALLAHAGIDRSSMRIIQVVGTNGKGSTVAFIESMLGAQNISCGLFTSPHLCSARERIRINHEMVSKHDFMLAADHVLSVAEAKVTDASFFEVLTAMAMWLFMKQDISIAILEAGLGGRLDATTALNADVLGITSIDFDHQNILGDTIEKIAAEKAYAARNGQLVYSVQQRPEAYAVLQDAAHKIGYQLFDSQKIQTELGLFGEHQKINAGLARDLVLALFQNSDDKVLAHGLKQVKWPGRFEVLNDRAKIVLDGAHNPAGMATLVESLHAHNDFHNKSLFIVYGSLDGDNIHQKIATLLASKLHIKRIYLHQPKNPRALSTVELRKRFVDAGCDQDKLFDFASMEEVKDAAILANACIVVCGSLYTVGEVRGNLLSIEMDHVSPRY